MSEATEQPEGFLASRHVALPRDTNTHGDIFGGWLMSQMDLAGGVSAGRIAKGRVVTIAVKEMLFLKLDSETQYFEVIGHQSMFSNNRPQQDFRENYCR